MVEAQPKNEKAQSEGLLGEMLEGNKSPLQKQKECQMLESPTEHTRSTWNLNKAEVMANTLENELKEGTNMNFLGKVNQINRAQERLDQAQTRLFEKRGEKRQWRLDDKEVNLRGERKKIKTENNQKDVIEISVVAA